MNYWLVKSDPETYGWENFTNDGSTIWDGVRNHSAKLNLSAMKKNDKVLFYHSGGESAVVGTAIVSKEGFTDPTAPGEKWVAIELKAGPPVKHPVTLKKIKSEPLLKNIPLIRISRLSVMPVSKEEYEHIVMLGRTP